MMSEVDDAEVRTTVHRGHDDLLSAGLGLAGLAGAPSAFSNPLVPAAEELRRRAILAGWKGIAQLRIKHSPADDVLADAWVRMARPGFVDRPTDV